MKQNENTVLLLAILGGVALVAFLAMQNNQAAPMIAGYQNEERYSITRDSHGRATELVVYRDSKVK